jgi:hypothetical protein
MDVLPARIIHALLNADRGNACAIAQLNSAALEIRLRRRASFQEKLDKNTQQKRALVSALFDGS